jgi:hypothetical protein
LTERHHGVIRDPEKAINENRVPGIGQNYGIRAIFAVFQVFLLEQIQDFVFSIQELALGKRHVFEGSLKFGRYDSTVIVRIEITVFGSRGCRDPIFDELNDNCLNLKVFERRVVIPSNGFHGIILILSRP